MTRPDPTGPSATPPPAPCGAAPAGAHDGLRAELAALAPQGLARRLRAFAGPQGPTIRLAGREVVNLCSNDYLGLATHPALRAAAAAALAGEGAGAASARLVAGNLRAHRDLESQVARFHGTAASLVFGSGYHANVGVLAALAGPDDVIYSDALNHASIVDGCRLARARVRVVPHADADALATALRREPGPVRRRLVVTESLFSVDGDVAPLADLAALCATHDALLIVDEAHAIGTLGPGGRGLCAAAGVVPDLLVGTFSKACASYGGYVAAAAHVVELLINTSRSFIFSTALPPPVVAASAAALTLIAGPEGDARRARLAAHATHLAAALARLVPGPRPPHHIQPLLVGPPARTMALCEALLGQGIFVQGIRPPTVPPGTSRLRFSLSAAHRDDDLAAAVAALTTAFAAPSPP
jgi:8-amino-7-oxononanoate synthase